MTPEELRQNFAAAFIGLVMNEASSTEMNLSSDDERLVIIQALEDAIAFFDNPEFDSKIP
tara:strand:- start:60 stop:239 length:180 start_codon:yes stop_codon:yes gene_type:complete